MAVITLVMRPDWVKISIKSNLNDLRLPEVTIIIMLCVFCQALYPLLEGLKQTNKQKIERTRTSRHNMISHGQKIGSTRVLLAMRSEVADCVCATLQAWSAQCERNISGLEVAQSYSVSVRQGPESTQFLLHSWRRHYTWRYRESGFSLSNSVGRY